jgi:uncharacterized membrane protein
MLTMVTHSLALMRFGGGRGGGFFVLLFGLAVVVAIVWALTQSIRPASANDSQRIPSTSPAPRTPERTDA